MVEEFVIICAVFGPGLALGYVLGAFREGGHQ